MKDLSLPTLDAFGDELERAAAAAYSSAAPHGMPVDEVEGQIIDLDALQGEQGAQLPRRRYRMAVAAAAVFLVVGASLGSVVWVSNDGDRSVVSEGQPTSTSPDSDQLDRHALVGQRAPTLVGTDINGAPFDLGEASGRWVVVTFTSAACLPCARSFEQVAAWARHQDTADATAVAVVVPDASASRIESTYRGTFDNLTVLSEFDASSVMSNYRIDMVPTTFIIDGTGAIRDVADGASITADEIDARLTEIGR